MFNRQSSIIIIAYCSCTDSKNQLKIANYVTVAPITFAHLTSSALLKSDFYKAKVTETTSNNQETYIGLRENEFKTRLNLHKSSYILEQKRTSTTLSDHVWKLKKKTKTSNSTSTSNGRSSKR